METLAIPAAQYVRMSTEHQQYSIANQEAAIKRYADEHGFVIVQSYEDVATSGLLLRNRPGLQAMLHDVAIGQSRFRAILVLDVSRWGRFQDIDESAHYEFVCRRAGVPVYYCSEVFSHELTLVNMILKCLKRSMAAEYSRELSVKVAAGHRRLASLGFRNGGPPGYGLRRLLVSPDRKPKQILEFGDRKGLATDRVILVPGPPEEVQCVREIFRMFIEDRLSCPEIADLLNAKGIPFVNGSKWYQFGVYKLLNHPKYCGSHVLGRNSMTLDGHRLAMPRETWLVVPNAFEPIVSPETFQEAQRIMHSKTFFKSNERVLEALRALWVEKGRLSQKLVDDARDLPSNRTFMSRFGGLRQAYQLIGYSAPHSSTAITTNRRHLQAVKRSLIREIVEKSKGDVWAAKRHWRGRTRLHLMDGPRTTVYLCRPERLLDGSLRWLLATYPDDFAQLMLLARMNEGDSGFYDYHVLPNVQVETVYKLKTDDLRLAKGIRFTDTGEFAKAAKAVAGRLAKQVASSKSLRFRKKERKFRL